MRLASEYKLTVIFVTHSVFESVYLSTRVIVMAARPGRLAMDLAMETPWPRSDEWRTSSEFTAEARKVSETLKETLNVDDIDH